MPMPITPRGVVKPHQPVAKNEFEAEVKSKLVGDNTVTEREAQDLVRGWGAKSLTPEQAEQLKAAVQGNKSTFAGGAERVLSRFVNVTLPTLTIRQPLGGIPATSARLTWNPPTTNVDGSPLTDLKGYQLLYGSSPGNYTKTVDINDPAATSKQIDNLPSGTTYFAIRAVAASGQVSALSAEVSKAIP